MSEKTDSLQNREPSDSQYSASGMGDIHPAGTIPRGSGQILERWKYRKTGEIRVGSEQITGPGVAAHALAGIRKSAQEQVFSRFR